VIARDLTKMQVRASVDEADIGNVKKGQRVTFTVDAFPEDVFEGNVKDIRLQASVAANVVTYITLVDAPNDDMKLKPGMTASITLFTREIPNTMLVSARAIKFKPDSALLKRYTIEGTEEIADKKSRGTTGRGSGNAEKKVHKADKAVVWVKKDSTLIRRVIETGLNDNANVQVLSGLNENDVVVSGVIQPGEEKAGSGAARSPFMPARRGGGGGGGGARPAGRQ
jgi:HlyD family secretion protein